jgi:xanthine dehydrogenase YagR molybdenum-binding subunit
MSMDVTSLPVARGLGAGAVVLPIDDQLIEVDDHVAGPLGVNGIGQMGQVGSAAAIASVVYPGAGYRVDDLPVAVADLLWHLSSEPAPAAAGAQRCAR